MHKQPIARRKMAIESWRKRVFGEGFVVLLQQNRSVLAVPKVVQSLCLLLLLWCSGGLTATGSTAQWLACEQALTGEQVWFRVNLPITTTMREAYIRVNTNAFFDIYVNACNVSTAALLPGMQHNKRGNSSITLDIEPFLCNGTNTLALWCSVPEGKKSPVLLSVSLWGTDENGRKWSVNHMDGWLCKPAPVYLNEENRRVWDASRQCENFLTTPVDVSTWLPATVVTGEETSWFWGAEPHDELPTIVNIHTLEMKTVARDTLYCRLNNVVSGRLRVTFRGAKRGERIFINNDVYVCKGEMDEQYYDKFSANELLSVRISGDASFRSEHVETVEVLQVYCKQNPNQLRLW